MQRPIAALLLPLSLLSVTALGQVNPVPSFSISQDSSRAIRIESIIRTAETKLHAGEEALAKGEKEKARQFFDEAVQTVDRSGVAVTTNSRFEAYYRDLLARIQKLDVVDQVKVAEDRKEVTEPAALDAFAAVKQEDLARLGPGGVPVFGRYDFDFSIGPPVLEFVNYFTAGRGKSTFEFGLQRSGRYREMAEKVFAEERVPLDLVWLAQAESLWKPNALSRAAAKGIWQFISATGARFGLYQNEWIDERSHPEKSTRAAARYLKWLNGHFAGDWMLAIAAYNSGEARVDDAIARCGYADFWELYRRGLLPRETSNYVPIILSLVIISKNQHRYGIDVKADVPLKYDTAELPSQTDLKVIADFLGIPYETVQELNPELRRGTSPPGQSYRLKIPAGMKKQFEVAYAKLPEDQRVRRVVIPNIDAGGYRSKFRPRIASYRTKKGDTLLSLSHKHGIPVKELARLNHISMNGTIRVGQTLRIPATKSMTKATKTKKGKGTALRSRKKTRRQSR